MHSRSAILLLSFVLPSSLILLAASAAQPGIQSKKKAPSTAGKSAVTDTFAQEVAPLVQKYCVGCHSAKNGSAGISLGGIRTLAAVLKDRDTWDKVAQNVESGHMPPKDTPHPTMAERDRIVRWIQTTLSNADCSVKDPGRVTLRRLNREEYNNTIRDLFGIKFRPADDFPSDDVGYGFDNIGDVLSISPLLMEKYLTAAEKVTKQALVLPDADLKKVKFPGDKLIEPSHAGAAHPHQDGMILSTVGEVGMEYDFPRDGKYILRVGAYGDQAGAENAKMAFLFDKRELGRVDVPAVAEKPSVYEIGLTAKKGKQFVGIGFLNDYYNEKAPKPKDRDRNLIVNYMEVVGPTDAPKEQPVFPESHKRIFITMPTANTPQAHEAAARRIIANFGRKAFRRPITRQEIDRLVRYVALAEKQGDGFEKGISLAVQAILVSPNFLFRVEPDPPSTTAKGTTPARLLNNYEMATRLSYFLWSSTPDEELLTLAQKGTLQDPKVLAAQVKRMLKDPKSKALGENFASQWLTLRNLKNMAPDPQQFPQWNEKLRESMLTETTLYFNAVVNEDRSVMDFLDSNYTFVNEPLAKLYGLPTVTGDGFQRVALTGGQRGGLLTQASILTVTSNPTRTSPVKRGKWVLENLLGTPPPPAPPDVPMLKEEKKGELTGSLKQKMEQHRKNPICASCHSRMDPLGFGLENFDAIGAWREKEDKFEIDSSGTLPNGKSFRGPAELKAILKGQKAQFVHCLAEKLMTYGLGRGLENYDKCAITEIVQISAKQDYKFSSLVTAVVLSDPFRKRKGDGGPG